LIQLSRAWIELSRFLINFGSNGVVFEISKMDKKQMNEKRILERELSQLMEATIQMEDEVNNMVGAEFQ
jgi:hypothetical protein